jgi:hypothetical protein
MGKGFDLADAAEKAYIDRRHITILQDAYSDLKVVSNIFPDLMVRVALARNIAFYYTTGSDKSKVLEDIQKLLNKIAADADGILAVKDGLITFLRPLRIKPINYKDVADWQNMQEAVAASA